MNTAKLGIIDVVRASLSGVPYVRKSRRFEWCESETRLFPFMFVLLSAILCSSIHVVWIKKTVLDFPLSNTEVFEEFSLAIVSSFVGCAMLVCFRWLIIAAILRMIGINPDIVVRRGASIGYFVAFWQPVLVSCVMVFLKKGSFQVWGETLYYLSISGFVFVTTLTAVSVLRGIQMEKRCRISYGILAILLCPECWLLFWLFLCR